PPAEAPRRGPRSVETGSAPARGRGLPQCLAPLAGEPRPGLRVCQHACRPVCRPRIRRGEIACAPAGTGQDGLPQGGSAALIRPLATDWSARRVASPLVERPEHRSELQQTDVCRLGHADRTSEEAYRFTQGLLHLVRERAGEQLDDWIAAATARDVAAVRRYARGLLPDKEAVRAGRTRCWSNGPVEGHRLRLKLLQRHMYG